RLFAVQAERARRARLAEEADLERTEPSAAARSGASSIGKTGDDGTMPIAPKKHCGAGSSGIAVDPYGNVYPCVQWRRAVGNLHERSIREIWTGSRDLDDIRYLPARAKQVADCYGAAGPLLN